jgi:hypothetical protein
MNGAAVRAPVLAALLALADVAAAQRDEDSDARCRELAASQDAGTLTVDGAVAALAAADEALARTAAAIVRHEWAELPPELFAALDREPRAARALLLELAVAPRRAAAAWAALQVGEHPGRSREHRCLALAARGLPFAAADVDLLLLALVAGDGGDGLPLALAVLPSKNADALLGKVHAALLARTLDVDRAGPLLDRLSAAGVRNLLGLVVALPVEIAQRLCLRVRDHWPELVVERAAASLDQDADLAPLWLPFAGPCLDRPERIAKVDRVVADEAAPIDDRLRAFDALLDARAVTPAVVALGSGDGGARAWARLLDLGIDRIPARALVGWLATERAPAVARALARRRVLEPELENALADALEAAGIAEGTLGGAAAAALAHHGGEAVLQRVWPLLRTSRGFVEVLDALSRRKEPFVPALLLAELQATAPDVDERQRVAQLDAVALALVALGDRRELVRLVRAAPTARPDVVRRCAHHARPLPPEHALALLDALPAVHDVDVAREVLAWAATAAGDERVRARLRQRWERPAETLEQEELREVALRALAAGADREPFVTALRQALAAGPLPPELEPLPFALLGSMPAPPGAADLALCTDLVLLAPRTDPAREAAAVRRWPDGTSGFPLVAAVAERLRHANAAVVEPVFAAAAAEALADPRHRTMHRAPLLALWRELVVVRDVQLAVGRATAELALAARGEAPDGPARFYALHACVARGQHAAAREHALRGRAGLLRLPEHRRHARVVLGERDPGAGVDPWAALAAAPDVCAWRDAVARGDHGAAAAAAARARDFAGHDAATLATLAASLEQSR